MVSLKSLAVALAVGVFSTTAAPSGSSIVVTDAITAREYKEALVYVCDRPMSTSRKNCEIFISPPGECFDLSVWWPRRVRSFENTRRFDFTCEWFENANCDGESYKKQEDKDIFGGTGHWNKLINSFRCRYR